MALSSYPAVKLPDARAGRVTRPSWTRPAALTPYTPANWANWRGKALQGDTFADTAALFLTVRTPEWSHTHAVRSRRVIEQDLIPKLGYRVMREITTPELILCLRDIEKRNALGVLDKAVILRGSLWDFAHRRRQGGS